MTDTLTEHIERFAAICALLDRDDGPATRASGAAGVGEAEWLAAREKWLPVLVAGEPDIAVRFARAYARACLGLPTLPEPDRTVEMAVCTGNEPVLPFKPRQVQPRPARAESEPGDTTLEVPRVNVTKAPVLPFAPPAPTAPAPAGRRQQRLQRFDTQTGRPLPEPVWVDEPEPPKGRGTPQP
jgi:hypothetical protein